MPTVLQEGSYYFFLTLGDCYEPPHVHVRQGKRKAKFWLSPVRLAKEGQFKAHELRGIERLVKKNRVFLLEAWEELCRGQQ